MQTEFKTEFSMNSQLSSNSMSIISSSTRPIWKDSAPLTNIWLQSIDYCTGDFTVVQTELAFILLNRLN